MYSIFELKYNFAHRVGSYVIFRPNLKTSLAFNFVVNRNACLLRAHGDLFRYLLSIRCIDLLVCLMKKI